MKIPDKLLVACLSLVVLLAVTGCGINSGKTPALPVTETETQTQTKNENDRGEANDNPSNAENLPKSTGPAAIKANEAGKVMILMYHVIGAPMEKPWTQTTDNFRRDLSIFNEQGYTLISLNDFIQNNIKAPAGRTPVVLTFDDASAGHFRYLVGKDGKKEIDPQCAVAILLEFGKKHPEFGHTATFYINDRPFGQSGYWQEKLQDLVKLGFDIGNHTLTHPKLNMLSDGDVQKELAGLSRLVGETVPGYQVKSLALPHGLSPRDLDLAVQGSYKGYEYKHEAILKVGANPAKSPNTAGFDPYTLPRVQASSEELVKWLEYFQKKPGERYISDGDPMTIAVPREKEGLVDKNSIKDKELIFWD